MHRRIRSGPSFYLTHDQQWTSEEERKEESDDDLVEGPIALDALRDLENGVRGREHAFAWEERGAVLRYAGFVGGVVELRDEAVVREKRRRED